MRYFLILIAAVLVFTSCNKDKKCWQCTDYSTITNKKGGSTIPLNDNIQSTYCRKTRADIDAMIAAAYYQRSYNDTMNVTHQLECVEDK